MAANEPQDSRSLEIIGGELIAAIDEKLMELKTDGAKLKLKIALTELVTDIETFIKNQNGRIGLEECILRHSKLLTLIESRDIENSWFISKIISPAKEYDAVAAVAENPTVWEVFESYNLDKQLQCVAERAAAEKAAAKKDREAVEAKALLLPDYLRDKLLNLHLIVFEEIDKHTLETSFPSGVVIKSISSQPKDKGRYSLPAGEKDDSSLQNRRVTSFAAKIIDLIDAAYNGVRTCHLPGSSDERKMLIKQLLDVITEAQKGQLEAKKDADRITFHVSSKSADRAKAYEAIRKAAGNMLYTFQLAYPEDVKAVADGMHITIALRK